MQATVVCVPTDDLPASAMYLDNKVTTLRHEDSVHVLWKVEGQLQGQKGNTRLPFIPCNGLSTFQKLMTRDSHAGVPGLPHATQHAGRQGHLELSRAAMRNLQLSGWLCSCPRKSWNLATALSPPGSLRTKQRNRLPVFAVMSGVGFCNALHVFGIWQTRSLPSHGMQMSA